MGKETTDSRHRKWVNQRPFLQRVRTRLWLRDRGYKRALPAVDLSTPPSKREKQFEPQDRFWRLEKPLPLAEDPTVLLEGEAVPLTLALQELSVSRVALGLDPATVDSLVQVLIQFAVLHYDGPVQTWRSGTRKRVFEFDETEIMSLNEAREYLGVGRQDLQNHCNQQFLRTLWIEDEPHFLRDEILALEYYLLHHD